MHPKTRSERRHQRERIIAHRRFIHLHIWSSLDGYEFMKAVANPRIDILYVFEIYKDKIYLPEYPEWGRYAKWNLICSCRGCRSRKNWEKTPAKRRYKLKTDWKNWEKEYAED